MKIKPTNEAGGVIVELGPTETQMPEGTAFRLKKILVPVDFSACSNKALQYAQPFAKQFGADLILLYVVEPYLPVPEMTTVDWDLIASRMREGGEAELAKIKATVPPEISATTELRVGTPAVEVVRAAKDLDADLIIISTHGRTGLAHVFLGSTAERIVRHASCPVLVVREREHEFV